MYVDKLQIHKCAQYEVPMTIYVGSIPNQINLPNGCNLTKVCQDD